MLTRGGGVVGSVVAAFITSVTLVSLLSGCSEQPSVVEGSVVTLAIEQPVTSLNDKTSAGNSAPNVSVAYATSSRFFSYDDAGVLVQDDSFGRVELVSESPLTVTYEINEGVRWSDGVPVDASDLLLAWAANSGRFTTVDVSPYDFFDALSGEYTRELPADLVFFDGANRSGLQLVTQLPSVGSEGRSITLVYDEYFPDWELAFEVGVPAHVVAQHAFPARESLGAGGEGGSGGGSGGGSEGGSEGGSGSGADGGDAEVAQARATASKTLVLDSILTENVASLAQLAISWNTAFTVTEMPDDASLMVSSGPYMVSAIVPNESITLTANPEYRGNHQPNVETVILRTIADPSVVVDALADGSVDIATPSVLLDVANKLDDTDGVAVIRSSSGTFEHLDLQFTSSKNGHFDDPRIREAFLLTVPREKIVAELVKPVNPDATTRDSHLFAPGSANYAAAVEANGSQKFGRINIARATALLAEAGVSAPQVCVLFDPRNQRRVSEFAMIQDSAAGAGFSVTDCSRPDWVEFLGVVGAYDASLFGWNETNRAISTPSTRLRSGSGISNLNYFANDEVDAALNALNMPLPAGERAALFSEIDALLWEQGYGLPLFQYPSLTAVSDRVSGVVPNPLAPGIVWNIWDWQPVQVSETPAASP